MKKENASLPAKAAAAGKEFINPDHLNGWKWFLHEITGFSVVRDVMRAARPDTLPPGRVSFIHRVWLDLKEMIREIRRLAKLDIKAPRETFAQACQRFHLTEKDIELRQFQATRLARVSCLLSLVMLVLTAYFVGSERSAPATSIGMTTVLITTLVATIKYEFRGWQITNRNLCSFKEWLTHSDRWFI